MAILASIGVSLGTQLVAGEFLSEEADLPRIEQLSANLQGEGAPLAFCWGQECEVAGVPIWLKRESRSHTTSRNIGGPDNKELIEFANIGLGWRDCRTGAISKVEKIYAGDRLIYDNSDNATTITRSSSSFTIEKEELLGVFGGVRRTLMVVKSSDAGVLLNKFRPGVDVVVSGFSNANNNGTFRCVKRKRSGSNTEVWLENDAVVVCAGSCGTATLTQTVAASNNKDVRSVSNFLGSATQTASSIIEATSAPTAGSRTRCWTA